MTDRETLLEIGKMSAVAFFASSDEVHGRIQATVEKQLRIRIQVGLSGGPIRRKRVTLGEALKGIPGYFKAPDVYITITKDPQ